MKTIALERGLDDLKAILEQRGYDTVYEDEINGYVSAYIYQEQDILSRQTFHASLNNSLLSDTASLDSSILLIHARGKSPDEIISVIENRVYSPLFHSGYY
jgi:hypothetical protein